MQRMPGGRRGWALGGLGLVGLLAVLAAALGSWPFGGDRLSRAELIAEGDSICARAQETFEKLQEDPPRTAGEAVALTETLIEIAEEELDEIDALDPPAEADDLVDRYLDAREEGIETMRAGLEAAEAGRVLDYEAAQARLARTQRDPRRRLAREIGFRRCSRPLVGTAELSRQARPPAGEGLDAPAP